MDEQLDCPVWWNGKDIVETAFCEEFMDDHRLTYDNSAFFTSEGRMTDERPLKQEIYHELKVCAVKNVPHTINNIVELLKFYNTGIDLTPQQDRVHLANGTLYLDGTFTEGKPEIVRSRLPIKYNPDAPRPEHWLLFFVRAFRAGGYSYLTGISWLLPDSIHQGTADDGHQGQGR